MTKLSSDAALISSALFNEVADQFLSGFPWGSYTRRSYTDDQSCFATSSNLRTRIAKNDDKETVIEVEVPGVEPSDVNVKIEGRSISVTTPRGSAYMAMGQRLSYDNATATLKHGMLTITLPKRESKTVEIKVTEN